MDERLESRSMPQPAETADDYQAEPGRGYLTTAEVKLRWQVFEHAKNKADLFKKTFDYLALEGNESILEVGSSDAKDSLIRLRKEYHHHGPMTAVDISAEHFIVGQATVAKEGLEPIDYIVGDMDNLSFVENGSIDLLLNLFAAYEAKDVMRALREQKLKMKLGARAVYATNGEDSIPTQRMIERAIPDKVKDDYPDLLPPKIRTKRFNGARAEVLLPSLFVVLQEYRKLSPVHFYPEDLEDIVGALVSRAPEYRPPFVRSGNLRRIIVKHFSRFFEREIEENGYVTEWMDRRTYICSNSLEPGQPPQESWPRELIWE